jgi:ubiquinone/menaquinone biosynthesis C-methylase UbiE
MGMELYGRHILPPLTHWAMRSPLLHTYRQRAASQASGLVLEIGFGSGLNLPFYDPARVARLYALEPQESMLKLARKAIARAPFPVQVLKAGAEQIPLPDQSMDTVLSTWTLCTIPAVEEALYEIRRVLKPSGQFLFAEHGLSPEPQVAGWQHRLTPLWRRCAGGCHLNRKHDELLHRAGFRFTGEENGYAGPVKIATYMYQGRAQRCQ